MVFHLAVFKSNCYIECMVPKYQVLIKLEAYLVSKLIKQLYILQNNYFSEKVRFPEVIIYNVPLILFTFHEK